MTTSRPVGADENAVLPEGTAVLLVRTAFAPVGGADDGADDVAWQRLVDAASTPNDDDFVAAVEPVDDRRYAAATPEQLRAALPEGHDHDLLFVADERTLTDAEHPLLVVPVPLAGAEFLDDPPRQPFRVVVAQLWSVENNLSLAHLDWAAFTGATDEDGTFRGF